MPNPLMDLIGPDGCDLDYKGSDEYIPSFREDDETIPQRKIDKAVKGFWEEVNPTIDDYSKLLLTMLEQKEKHGKKIPI